MDNNLTLAIKDFAYKLGADLVGVANIKYANKIYSGDVVFAEAEVKRKTNTGYIVWVKIKDEADELKFKGKFILKGIK